jgi:class 3 adenylate cyclase/CHASE2 domain-containing sensor protein|tara:strand:+ start:3764 stop:6631 length:2868 start_codon:yes stop_codon:yes gene_type:complete
LKKNLPYLLISISIALFVIFLAIFNLYDTIEHKLLDMRFTSRGLIETRDDIATLDIDVRALQKEGKWDPWSREKHIPMVEAAGQHGMDILAFDIYFIEHSERELNFKVLSDLTDSLVTMDVVKNLFPDPDNDLAVAAKEAKNIYFAQSFKPQPKKREKIKKRTKEQDKRLDAMVRKGLFREVNPADFPTLFNFYDGEFPLASFIDSSAGVYFFQAKSDKDGVMRKYPLVGLYENRLFPSISLSIALDHYKTSFNDVEIIPGKYLRFKPAVPDEFGRDMITIPINKEGLMQVNWAGNWEDADGNFDLMHYPYSVLKDFQKNEYKNYVLSEFKRITNLSYDKNVKAAYKPSLGLINAEKKDIFDAVKKSMMMGAVENWILKNPDGVSKDFKKVPSFVFNEIKNNNVIASSLLEDPKATLNSLIQTNKVILSYTLENYTFSTYKQLRTDLNKAVEESLNADQSKVFKKSLADLALIERNHQIIYNLYKNKLIDEQRPLFFYPNAERLIAGNEEKGNARLIVPFEFYGKKLYYGLTATGTHDLNPMPFNPRYPMVGLHANALNTILNNDLIHEVDLLIIIGIILFIGVLLAFGVPALTPSQGGIATGTILVAYSYLSFWLFSNQNIWLDLFGPMFTLALGYLGITVYNYIQEEKNKQFLKESFGTYVSPELIDQMYESGEEPSLGGSEGYHTAFFTDIQSFSAFSEKLSATDLVGLLNEYLTDMTDVLLENKGTLDKYIGDAIVAFYGAPIPIDQHELWACKTAIKMQDNLAVLREKWQEEGDRWPEIVHHMQNRIGINTGQMVTGNMGSASRMNYTMMGDTVNLAARLEASAKQYGVYIQIADTTYQPNKEILVVRDLDFVRVMGKEEPVQVWELIAEKGKESEIYNKILPAYHEALKLYKNQDFKQAIDAFKESDTLEDMFPGRKTNPSRVYIPRCEHFLQNPPGDDWDGVWTLTSK